MQTRLQVLARQRSVRLMALLPIVVAATLVAGCGDKSKSEGGKASQAAARVNDDEITVHQINQLLERQQGLKPEQMDAASRQALEALIDQQLAVAKAEEQKLDRDPQVVQMLDSMRRTLLARTYLERSSAAGAGTPTPAEVRKYYDDKPALFAERKVYAMQEFTVPATKEQTQDLIPKLKAVHTPAEYAEVIKAAGLKFSTNQVTQAAEGLPLAILDPLSKVENGESLFITGTDGFKAILVMATKSQPATFEQAKPAIEQFLTIDRRREFAKKELKNLRDAAKIEYIGKFAEKPAAAASGASSVTATPSVAASAPSEAASSGGLDAESISKGLSGLK
ncbi:MAG: EpsD family peptidyl-prolyl cis-trans isomerase [Aquabacterium sp.]